jgi:DNA modification methylase
LNLYDVALQVTDEVLGKGSYAELNKNHPDPKVQEAIRRAEEMEVKDEVGTVDDPF